MVHGYFVGVNVLSSTTLHFNQ